MFVPCISNKMPRELPLPSSFPAQLICIPTLYHCPPFPSSRNVLLDTHPKPFSFKSIPLPLPPGGLLQPEHNKSQRQVLHLGPRTQRM